MSKNKSKNKYKSSCIKIIDILFLALFVLVNQSFAFAQTASILPPAKTTFLDSNGKPLVSGTVTSYIPGTTTPKTTWQDAAETIPNANPLTLDSAGRALLLGSGSYRQIVKDRIGNLIWDQVTSSTGSGGGGGLTATGDGDLVGTIKPWAGMTAPNQYAFTYGQELSRTTFSVLFTAITSTQAAFCTSGSPIVSGIGDTTNFWIGMSVEIPCVGAGFSTIISKTSSSVTLAVNANTNLTTTAIFFPWGRGNGTTTFNLPDFRGLIPAGNNIMGGISSSNMTTAFFGAADPNSSGGQGGGQSIALGLTNLPAGITSLNTSQAINLIAPGGGFVYQGNAIFNGVFQSAAAGGSGSFIAATNSNGWAQQVNTTTNNAIAVTSNNTGSGGSPVAFSRIPPTKTVNYIIKTTPDVNSATASGVTSLGGMTGSIACGTGLTCTGNTISSNVTVPVSLINGGLGGSQAAATAGQVPVFPGGGGSAVPTTFTIPVGANLIRNSGLGLVTHVATTFVGVTPGQQIALSGWAQQGGAGSGNARFTSTSSFIAGLRPGKLVAIMGFSNTISFTATVTGSNTITATTSVFTGAVGDLLWNTAGNNHSSKSQWRIASLSGCTSGCTTVVVQGALVNEAGVTFTNMQQIQGGYALADQTVNGMPQAGNVFSPAFTYYPLQVTAVGANFFDAQLAGRNLNIGATSTGSAWEVTNGSMGTGCIGPDWWSCTATLSFFKMRGTDWNGTTVVNMPGALYSAKLIKGATTQELFYQDLQAAAPAAVDVINYTGLANFQGKTLTCAAYIWAPNANEGRIFINDGVGFTFGSFVTPGSFQWTEVSATISNSATTAQFGMSMGTGTVGDVFFLTQPICKFGAGTIGVGNYQPAPPTFHMFTNHTNPFFYINVAVPANTFINIEQETSGCIPSGMESILADIGGANPTVGAALQLSDSPGSPQMSALVNINPVNSASQTSNQTGQVAITKVGSGDGGVFVLDKQWINVNGSATWTKVTIDYLGGVY